MKTSSLWLRAGLVLAVTLSVATLLPKPAQAGTKAQIAIEQAKVEFSDKNYQKALDLINQALAEEPNNGEALQYAGLCDLALGKPEEAMGHLQQAADAMPQDPGVREDLAQAAIKANKFDAALAAADSALALDSSRSRANLYKGMALIGLKRNEEALKPLAAVGGREEQAGQYYSGTALLNLGRTSDAAPYFKQAQKLGPETELGRKSAEYLGALGGGGGESKDYKARIRLLYQYDSNVVTVAGDEFLPAGISNMADSRGVVDADLAWYLVNTDNARIAVRYLGYANFQFEQTPMNLMYHMGELSGYYVAPVGSVKLKSGLAANYSWAALEGDGFSDGWKTTPYFEIGWTKNSVTGIDVEYGQETFFDDFDGIGASPLFDQRDNTRTHVTLRQSQTMLGGKLNLLAGYRWGNVWAEGRNYNRQDNAGFAGLQAALPAKSVLSFMARYEDRLYPTNGFDRHDRLLVGNLSYEIPIVDALHFYTSVVYTNVDSNQSALEYDRWILGAGVVAEL